MRAQSMNDWSASMPRSVAGTTGHDTPRWRWASASNQRA